MAQFGSRSFEEVYRDSTEGNARYLARTLARRYASTVLGNADDQMLDHYYSNPWSELYNQEQVSYTILDENGEILHQQDFAAQVDSYEAHTFTFEDLEYVNVVSAMTQEEYNALHAPAATEPAAIFDSTDSQLTVYCSVPMEGCEIGMIQARYPGSDSLISHYIDESGLGTLSYISHSQLIFSAYPKSDHGQIFYEYLQAQELPTSLLFIDTEGQMVLELSGSEPVVESVSDGYVFLKPLSAEAEIPSIYDAIPSEGQAVTNCSVTYADGFEESVGGSPSIGWLRYEEDGHVRFKANFRGLLEERFEDGESAYVTRISFHDEDGNLVYEANDPDGVGYFFLENDNLYFQEALGIGMAQEPSVTESVYASDSVYIYDDVPPGNSLICRMELQLSGDPQIITIGNIEDGIGYSNHDAAGNVTFTAKDWKDFVFSKPAQVTYIKMLGEDNRLMFEAYSTKTGDNPPYLVGMGEPIGTFAYSESGQLVFTFGNAPTATAYSVTDPTLETSPMEAVEETLPEETLDETIPEDTGAEAALEETLPGETAPDADQDLPAAEETVPETTEDYTQPETLDQSEDSPTEPTIGETVAPDSADNTSTFGYRDLYTGETMVVEYTAEAMPVYTVEVFLSPNAVSYQYEWVLLGMVYKLQDSLIPILIGSLLLIAITVVYLCCSAGRKPGTEEVRAGGLNRLPLDLYLVAAGGGVILCFLAYAEGAPYLFEMDLQIGILYSLLVAFAASLLVVAFCFGFVAQIKTPDGYWWRNSILGRSGKILGWLWNYCLRLCNWCWKTCKTKLWPLAVRICQSLWKLACFFWQQLKRIALWCIGKLKAAIGWISQKIRRFMSMLPLTWQWLLVGFILVFFLYAMIRTYKVGYILIGFGAFFGVLLYAASAFGTLLDNAKKMRQGDLDTKVDDKLLIGSFQDFADELNGLADVAVVAAQKQLKSERMKTELITNVSHDIKTPLTSIINYVDLMEKPHTPEEQQAYLEVLARQSQRLKKLIDDLMEMSKASTGNMAVEITKVNAVEAVNQALGEFADKLDKAQLTPIFRQPEPDVLMMADGRLVWRVLSNLLSNAVKYALPGTRVYIDLMELDGKVVLSLKNISRDSLNIHADELLERFVRGDTSRNTEGSGLGLNIAKSLMELQKGKLELLVDGDLFKVTLIFPGA